MKNEKTNPPHTWQHAGGKLIEEGADKLSDTELLSIIIGTGTKGKTAEEIAKEIIRKFGGFKGMANQPLVRFLEFKGLGDVKIIRIAAAFEMARRITENIIEQLEPDKKVISKDTHENIIAWAGKIYRALTIGFMTQDQIDNWIVEHGEEIYKFQADKKVVTGFNKSDDYIVCSGKLYRAITSGIKSFDEITEWTTDNMDFILELEKVIEKKNGGKNKK